jgi:hypothetical protein
MAAKKIRAQLDDNLLIRMPSEFKERFQRACEIELTRPSAQARMLLAAWVKEMAKSHPEILDPSKGGNP